MGKALLAAGAVATLVMGVPIAGATTLVVAGATGVGGKPSLAKMQALVDQGFIPPDDLVGIDYPAQLWPVAGSITMDDSVAQGVDALDEEVQNTSGHITMVGISEGAVVLNYEKRRLMAQDDPPQDVTFVTVSDPTNSDGGVLAKFSPLYVPILNVTFTGPPPVTPYDTIEYVREYDGVADFPDHPLNVVADLNALAGGIYLHPNYGGLNPNAPDVIVTHSTNSLQGETTHYLFPTKDLPLTQPLRDAGVDSELVDAIDKPLRRIIDAGYDGERPDRTTPSTSDDVIVTHSTNSLQRDTTHYPFPTKDLPLTQPLRDTGMDSKLVDAIDKPPRRIIDAGYDGERPDRTTRSTSRPAVGADGKPSVDRPIRNAIKGQRAATAQASVG
nr:PE-PPE domain-containing protein [Mycobacterium sp.]